MKAWIRDFLKSRTARITGMLVVGNVVILLASAWVISVLTTDYQALADKFDEQRAQDLVDTVVEQVLWTEHQGIVDSVVSEVVQSGGLREAFDADQAALESALEDEFGRQAISGGAISPIGLTAYDADLEALTTVWHEDSYSLPSDLVEAAREREGRERMQAFTTVWSDGSQPILTVMRPVGSFSVEGYVAFHVDPVPVLAGLDSLIRQSLVVTDSKGDTVLAEGAGFDLPEGATVRRSDLTVRDPEGNTIAHLEGRQDVTEITGALANARGDALELFLLVGGGTALAVTFGLGFIVRRSEVHERAIEASAREAEEREAQLRAEREEADRRSKREQEELRRQDILGLAGELDTEVVATIHETRASALEMITKAGSMAETADVAVQDASRVRERCEEATGEISGAASACEELQSSVEEIVRQIGDATNATQSASNEARDANGRVDRLGEAASNINDVVKLIQDIAEQTNLLALNATIEAARAGEAGKGFAVVAGEVKGLATKTAEATGSIAERVRQIQDETDATVAVIGRIAQAVGDVEERLSSVSSATEQQTSATGSIARTVAAVDTMARNVVEEISGTVERVNQTSNSSSDLKGTLEQLTRQIEGAHKQALNVVEGLRSRAHDTHADAVAQDGSADQPSSEKDGKAA